MALSDRQRHEAYEALTEAFTDRTDLVIEMLRPAHDLATTTDIDSSRRALGQEIAAVRHDVGQEIAAVRHDLEAFRGEVAHEFAAVRHEIAVMGNNLELSLERRINEAFTAQTPTLVLGLVGAFALTALTNVLTVLLG